MYAIEDGTLLSGSLPVNKNKLVIAWIEIHKEDLFADWELAVNGTSGVMEPLVSGFQVVELSHFPCSTHPTTQLT